MSRLRDWLAKVGVGWLVKYGYLADVQPDDGPDLADYADVPPTRSKKHKKEHK